MRSSMSLRAVLVLSVAIAGAAMFALPAGTAQAANLTWDTVPGTVGAGNGTITGGNGTWDTTTGNWTSDGGANNVAWNNAADPNDTAVFGGTAGTVTLGANITVGGLRFDTTAYALSNGANTLTFGDPNNSIALNNVNAASWVATITGAVGGTGNVTVSLPTPGIIGSTGLLTLNGTSAGGWSGATTVNSRTTVALAASNQALVSTSAITLNGGGITLTNTNTTEAGLDRVSNTAGITSNGGTITYTNTSGADTYAETIGSVALTSGQLNIVEATNQASTGSQTLTLSGLTRPGATSAVTFSAATTGPQASGNKNMIAVTGGGTTSAGQIIGPWATTGTAAANQTDYAVYNADYVVPANIAANNNETTWGTGTDINLGAAATLTWTRTLNTLRYSGAAAALALGANNLETYGLLNGGTGLLTVSGTGALTTPAGGGNLFVTTGNNAITVSSPINDNGGAVTLVKSGTSTLTLSGTNTYTGGTVINAGTLTVSSDNNLGVGGAVIVNGTSTLLTSAQLTFNRAFTLNNGAMLIWDVGPNNSDSTISGAVTGSGGIIVTETLGLVLTSTSNNFTGPIGIANAGIYAGRFTTNSLADVPGAGRIRLGSATGYGAGTFTWGAGAISPLTLNNRQIDLASPSGSGWIVNDNANDANTITVNTDLLSTTTTAGTRTLVLGGVNTGNNTFAGKISDGAGVVSLTKSGAGTWILSGTNTYTGVTTVSAGTLNANAAKALGAGSVTVSAGTLVIGAADAMADTAALRLPSATAKNLTMNADDTVGSLYLGGLQQPNNTYTSSALGSAWMNAGSGILTVGSAAAQPVYWDLNDTGSGAGGETPAGTWDAANTYWNAVADGTGSTSTWSEGRTATFAAGTDATGTYTVTVDGTRDIGGLTFEEGNVTLSGGTALRMTADSLAYVATGLTATVSTPISQDATARSFTKGGTGTLILNAANAYTGTTTVNAGTLVLPVANACKGATAVNAGTLRLTNTDALASSSGLTLANGTTLELRSDTSATFTTPLATVSAGSTTTIDVNNNGTGSGNTLTLSGGIRFENPGSPNSVTATVNITGGNDYVLRTGVSLNPGGNPYTLTLNPTGVNVEISSATGPATGSPTYILGGTSTGNKVLSTAPVSAWMYFTKSGTGTWTWEPVITGSNIIGAMIISQGKLIVTGTLLAQGRTDQTNRCVRVNGGQLDYNSAGAVNTTGTTSALIFGGGNLDNSSGAPITTSTYNPVQLWNANFTFIGSQGANSDLNLGTGAVTMSATRQVTVQNAATTLGVGGIISGATYGLTKAGEGTLALSGACSYTGPTTVNQGTLLVNGPGSLAAASAVTVNTGGTLGGTGTINGAVTVNGTLAPGASAGTLTVNNSLAMETGSTYVWQLGSSAADLVDVNGTLALSSGGWNLKLMNDGGTPGSGQYDLFTYDTFSGSSFTLPTIDPTGTWTTAKVAQDTVGKRIYLSFGLPGDTNGDFVVDAADYIALKTNFGMTEGATLAQGNFDADIDGNVDWDDLQILMAIFGTRSVGGAPAVPEPATLGLLAIGALAMLRRRRK